MIDTIALIAGIILPLWNIPLIFRIIKRKSSRDISAFWAIGVWTCLLVMAPSAFTSEDRVWKIFSIFNLAIFSFVVIFVLVYRKSRQK